MDQQIVQKRIFKELRDLEKDPRPGITCYPKEDDTTRLEAYIEGPPESPYEQGLFKLSIQIPNRYPFEPPQIKFVTRIYHPNIDDGGRICADILKTGEHGGWNPAINIATALMSLRQLIATPNPDDPLEVDIAQEYQLDYPTFELKAIEFTKKYASKENVMNQNDEEEQVEKVEKEEEEELSELEEYEEKPKSRLSLSKKKTINNSQSSKSSESQKSEDIEAIPKPIRSFSRKTSSNPPIHRSKSTQSQSEVENTVKPAASLLKKKSMGKALQLQSLENVGSTEKPMVSLSKKKLNNQPSTNIEQDVKETTIEQSIPKPSLLRKKSSSTPPIVTDSSIHTIDENIPSKSPSDDHKKRTTKKEHSNTTSTLDNPIGVIDIDRIDHAKEKAISEKALGKRKATTTTLQDTKKLKSLDFDNDTNVVYASQEIDDHDIALGAIEIINKTMPLFSDLPEEEEEDIYHGFSLAKKSSTKSKICLSRSKR